MPAAAMGAEAGGDAGPSTTFTDNGGPVISNVHVQLIFWGSAWSGAASPTAAQVTNAVQTILNGSYMTGLSQYRGIGRGLLRGTSMITTSNPPNPFSDTDVANLIASCLNAGAIAEPDEDTQILYCVIMPVGVRSTNPSFVGEHTFFTYTHFELPFDFDNDRAHYAWVTNNGSLDAITTIFSHELVESATDPEGSAILGVPGTCSQSGWCEIGDVCNSTGVLNGVRVQSYWSQRDRACVIPTGLPRWTGMGGGINGGLTAIRNADGRLEVFARGTDAALWHIWQTARSNGWSGWGSLGGWITGRNAVVRNADGRLEIFVRGADGALWHQWQTAPSNGWSGWASLGGGISDLFTVGVNADGRIEVFAQGTDHGLWHIWQTAPSNGWSGWAPMGGQIQTVLSVANNADGRLEVFTKGLDNALWHIWQTAPSNGWSGWGSMGGALLDLLAAGRNADGRLELFVRGTDSGLYHIWQTSPSDGWSGWGSMGGAINDVLVLGTNADGRLEVFARGTDNGLWHQWQTAPSNGWSGWAPMGGQIADLAAVDNNADGRLEVFVRGFDSGLWHIWQTAPSNGWNM